MVNFMLFGAPRIERDGSVSALHRSKALALLAYLAVTAQPQDRETLTTLLWPEFDQSSARNNLRRELSLLKSELGDAVLIANRRTIAVNLQALTVDIHLFRQQVAAVAAHRHAPGELCVACMHRLTAAVALYTTEFMAGFSLADAAQFDEWQFFLREELRHTLASVLQALNAYHCAHSAYDLAVSYARRYLALDPLHEPAHRELMQLYASTGQKAAALRQYAECVRILQRELGIEPEAETTALFAKIRSRPAAPPAAAAETVTQAAARHAPVQPAPLANRSDPDAEHLPAEPLLRMPGPAYNTRLPQPQNRRRWQPSLLLHYTRRCERRLRTRRTTRHPHRI